MVQRIGSSDLIQADLESNVLLVEKIVTMAPATWFLPQLADKDEIDVDEPDSALGDMDESDDGVSGEADSQPVSSIGRSSGHYRATSDTDVKLATVKEGAQSFEHFLQSALSLLIASSFSPTILSASACWAATSLSRRLALDGCVAARRLTFATNAGTHKQRLSWKRTLD